MRLEYTRSERRRKAVAQGIIDNPTASPEAKADALKTLDHLEKNALRRATPLKAEAAAKKAVKTSLDERAAANPDLTGLTRAQARYVTELLERGDEQAEVWRLTYLAEAGLVNLDQMVADERSGKVPRVPLAVPDHQNLFPEVL